MFADTTEAKVANTVAVLEEAGRRYRAPRRYDTLYPKSVTARDYRQAVPVVVTLEQLQEHGAGRGGVAAAGTDRGADADKRARQPRRRRRPVHRARAVARRPGAARPAPRRTELSRPRGELPLIKAAIPERIDQINGRLRRGERLCRLDRAAYRRRNVVERCFNKLKYHKALATRYDKRARGVDAGGEGPGAVPGRWERPPCA
ncbi:hypothetical protein [Streptomyces achromogenes]|uniref:hypothetical protein n=1 Tax=Streptomyces achromogenes TaxID=67255 RepID=UPI0036F5F835